MDDATTWHGMRTCAACMRVGAVDCAAPQGGIVASMLRIRMLSRSCTFRAPLACSVATVLCCSPRADSPRSIPLIRATSQRPEAIEAAIPGARSSARGCFEPPLKQGNPATNHAYSRPCRAALE
jgi:hypothetical protein